MEDKTKGIISLISGFLWGIMLGNIFIWGNIVTYVTSYFRIWDESLSVNVTFSLLAIQTCMAGILMYPATALALKLGPRLALIIAGSFIMSGVFISSFVFNYWVFFVFYSVFVCIGWALSMPLTWAVPWSYFPQHKGKITGLMGSSTLFGASIMSILTGLLANPDNLDADIEV